MKVLGIIPARGGSKGVPRKNIRPLAGRPLIEYTINACKQSKALTNFTVSTEDQEIVAITISNECHVTHRPVELSRDNTPSLPVVQHAVKNAEIEFITRYDFICLLQPTTPLRQAKHIDEAVKLIIESKSDSVVSVCQIPDKFHPNWAFIHNDQQKLVRAVPGEQLANRRQDLAPAYFRNGSIYLVRRDTLMKHDSLYGETISSYVMHESLALNIDTSDDWELAERYFTNVSVNEGRL